MTRTEQLAQSEPNEAHGVLGRLHRPEWLSALEHAFEATPMRIEQWVAGDEFVVQAEIPGIDPEKDIEINVTEGLLQMRAERRERRTGEADSRHHSEFHYGSFSRVVALPAGARETDVTATYRDGILEIRVLLDHHEAEATRVPVRRA